MALSLDYVAGLFEPDTSYLATAYGLGGARSVSAFQSPASALLAAERDGARNIKLTAAEPEVALALKTFTSAVKNAKNVGQLLANQGAMRVLLTANGLGDQANYPALAKRALLSDPADKKSLVNALPDTRWKAVAKTYQFGTKGLSVIQNPKVIEAITHGYAEFTWRESLEQATPGLSKALTFRTEAKKFTNVDQILGDKLMRDVVTTALGIPKQIAFQPLEAQEKAITSRLKIEKLQDSKFVENFARRYLLAAATQAGQTDTPDFTALATRLRGLVV